MQKEPKFLSEAGFMGLQVVTIIDNLVPDKKQRIRETLLASLFFWCIMIAQ